MNRQAVLAGTSAIYSSKEMADKYALNSREAAKNPL